MIGDEEIEWDEIEWAERFKRDYEDDRERFFQSLGVLMKGLIDTNRALGIIVKIQRETSR